MNTGIRIDGSETAKAIKEMGEAIVNIMQEEASDHIKEVAIDAMHDVARQIGPNTISYCNFNGNPSRNRGTGARDDHA